MPKFPNITVQLTGTEGNVFAVICTVCSALKLEGLRSDAMEFQNAAFQCASYDEVLQLCLETVEVV